MTKKTIRGAITDERKAGPEYREMARAAEKRGDPKTASIYNSIAKDEDKHLRLLRIAQGKKRR